MRDTADPRNPGAVNTQENAERRAETRTESRRDAHRITQRRTERRTESRRDAQRDAQIHAERRTTRSWRPKTSRTPETLIKLNKGIKTVGFNLTWRSLLITTHDPAVLMDEDQRERERERTG